MNKPEDCVVGRIYLVVAGLVTFFGEIGLMCGDAAFLHNAKNAEVGCCRSRFAGVSPLAGMRRPVGATMFRYSNLFNVTFLGDLAR